jgi:hypothetical protein
MWPDCPYPGLRFYSESDAILFRERETDILRCERALLRFGVKILILQGVSGAGKSSFLRAGLIPYLRRRSDRACIFLSGHDCTIRCTADPLPEIAEALVKALDYNTLFDSAALAADESDVDGRIEKQLRSDVCARLRTALTGARQQLAIELVRSLCDTCSQLSGKLMLILDQAEEVLTHVIDEESQREASSAFFFFLEELYVQNIDVRLIISIRTEYYGRFRDELRIGDDRMADRPRSGGIEPHLLKSLRDKSALYRAMTAPINAMKPGELGDHEQRSVYNFCFQPGVLEEILDEVLSSYPVGSVTPILQIICSALYAGLSKEMREISRKDFYSLGRADGMMRTYVEEGVAEAAKRNHSRPDQWLALLHSLVSRQGGGTLVSLSESVEELERRARLERLEGDVRATFYEFSSGPRPLLRGEPKDSPRSYSLQHDVLAAVLVRWKTQFDARKAARQNRQRIFYGAGVFLIAILSATLLTQTHSTDLLVTKQNLVYARNILAREAPNGSFRQSLLLSLTNLQATEKADTLYEYVVTGNVSLQRDSVRTLRTTLARMPALSRQARSVGLDPVSGRVAVLAEDLRSMTIYHLPENISYQRLIPIATLELPNPPQSKSPGNLPPSVGFLDGLGPVALISGVAYFWSGSGERITRDLYPMLPEVIRSSEFIRCQFVAGKLLLSAGTIPVSSTYQLSTVYVGSDELLAQTALPTTRVIKDLRLTSSPIFSLSDSVSPAFAYIDDNPSLSIGLELQVARMSVDSQPGSLSLSRLTSTSDSAQRPPMAAAFVANKDSIVLKGGDSSRLYQVDVDAILSDQQRWRPSQIDLAPLLDRLSTLPSKTNDLRLVGNAYSGLGSPLAAVRIGGHLRAAWSAPRGIWIAETSEAQPQLAHRLPGITGPLMSGSPGGNGLLFSNDGKLLLLIQQRNSGRSASVMIWDLRRERVDWFDHVLISQLKATACALLEASPTQDSSVAQDLQQYQTGDTRSLCEH